MKVGYARVSMDEQNLTVQIEALEEAGCERIYSDKASGSKTGRPGFQQALDYMREGDLLVVWCLDQLGRSLIQLNDTMSLHEARGFNSDLTTKIRTGVIMLGARFTSVGK
jgi:DNA invertase Pin-like site-specific DNA recombinase